MSTDSLDALTFGDVRRMVVQTIVDLRAGRIDASKGMAIAANMKVLNDNIQVEINAAKLALLTEGRANSFGKVVQMGRRMIGNDGGSGASNAA